MIAHRPVRLALRARLLTLSVCTTGPETLEATATGYARTSGDFLADGFARGMELVPSGFASNAPAVVTAVTAQTLTVAGGRPVEAPAAGRSLSVGLPTARTWENVEPTPIPGVPYIVEQYAPGPTQMIGLSIGGQVEGLPMYTVLIHVPADSGVGAADAYADAVLAHFAPRTVIPVASAMLRVRGDTGPYRGGLLQAAPGFAVVPVSIPLWLRVATPV